MPENIKDIKNWHAEVLNEFRSTHSSLLIKSAQYVGYSILIALSYYGKNFVLFNQCLAVLTAVSATVSLILAHIFSLYIFAKAESIIRCYKWRRKRGCNEKDDKWIEHQYDKFEVRTVYIFCFLQGTLFVSIILFAVTSYYYFFGDWPLCMCKGKIGCGI